MKEKRFFRETELAHLAKRFREKSGKTKAQIARELNVTRATIQDAEESPTKSLTKIRRRMIEACSASTIEGPVFYLAKKTRRKSIRAVSAS